jgi:hypothetical protein
MGTAAMMGEPLRLSREQFADAVLQLGAAADMSREDFLWALMTLLITDIRHVEPSSDRPMAAESLIEIFSNACRKATARDIQ